MRRWLRVVIAAIAAVLALLVTPVPTAHAVAPSQEAFAFTYGGHQQALVTLAITDLGPPIFTDTVTTRECDDRWSRSGSAHPERPTRSDGAFDCSNALAQGVRIAAVMQRSVEGTDWAHSLLRAGSVAANAGTRSIDDLLRPGGVTVGKAGTDDTIREITGGLTEAQAMFQQLSQGGNIVSQTSKLTRVELPNGGGFVQLRTVMSRSPNTTATIDVNIPGLGITKLKYNP